MAEDKQPDLFPADALPPAADEKRPPVRPDASIQAALGAYETYMRDEGFALNTRKSFASDIRLLGKYLGMGQPVGEIGTKNLNDFLDWLVNDRGVPCSPKSYARRVTTLKSFFGWLNDADVLAVDPSAAVIQRTVSSPLPTLATEEEIARALEITQAIRRGRGEDKPDARPHLLLTLLLQTAVKKSEAMAIVPNHIDRGDPENPVLFVRYANPRLRNKERKLPLEPEWLETLDEYLAQYEPQDTLFTCTARNLEYILRDISDEAGIAPGTLSFENLRWYAALRDYTSEDALTQDDIRQKLGLSKVTWRDTKSRLEKMKQRQLDLEGSPQ